MCFAHKGIGSARRKAVRKAVAKVTKEKDAEIAELKAKLADFEDTYRIVIEEKCAGDEIHCTCVPSLRRRIAALEAERGAAIQRSADAHLRMTTAEARVKELEAEKSFTYCAYCGERFESDGDEKTEAISAHIAKCEKHPMRAEKAKADAFHVSLAYIAVSVDKLWASIEHGRHDSRSLVGDQTLNMADELKKHGLGPLAEVDGG